MYPLIDPTPLEREGVGTTLNLPEHERGKK